MKITKAAIDKNEDPALIGKLFDHYYEINAGIGAHKITRVVRCFSQQIRIRIHLLEKARNSPA